MQKQEGFIEVEGGKIWYTVAGSGSATPLMVLHGGPGLSSDYLMPLSALGDERPVVFYDQLGSGKSDKPKDKSLWRSERFVKELTQVRDALDLQKIHLFGHSWGTMLTMDYMPLSPPGILSLVMASPAISVKRWIGDAQRLRAALTPEIQEILNRHEQAGTVKTREYQAASTVYLQKYICRANPLPLELINSYAKMGTDVYETMWGPYEFDPSGNLGDYDRSNELRDISIPTLFTCGRYDEATPETTAWYQSLVPNSTLAIFENSAHMAMLEERGLYTETIRRFLKQVDQA